MDQGNDRISKLPDDIIHHILSFLDMRYAMQTSTLSQRWKLIWTSTPHLNLSSREFDTLPKFARFVKHVLSHRNNLTDVSAVELFFTGAVTQYFMRSITSYACSHNVNRMTITYFPKKCHEFPLRLFNHHTLRHLTLRVNDLYFRGSCSLPKSAWNFPALETLHLSYITFCENTDKSLDLFSKCVNLKNLTLHEFTMLGLEVFNICAPQLSNLTIIEGRRRPKVFNVVAPQLQNLTVSVFSGKYVVSAPHLSSITCKGRGPLQLSTDGFCYLEKANLNLSVFSTNREKDVTILLDLLQKLGSAKFLTLHVDVVETLSSCLDRLSHEPCPFDNLNCLRIDALKSEKDHTATMSTQVRNYFLENSPHAIVIMDLPEATKLGRQPNHIELFERTHEKDKGKGEWCDSRSEHVAEQYKLKIAENPSEENSLFDAKAWVEAVGGPKKNRGSGFGLTNDAETVLGPEICPSSRRKRMRPTVFQDMATRLQEMEAREANLEAREVNLEAREAKLEAREAKLEARVAKLEARVEANLEARIEETIQRRIKEIFENIQLPPRPPPTD